MNAPDETIEAQVANIRAMLERNEFAAALAAGEALAALVPENRDVLYLVAVSQRHLQRIPEAFATLERIERLYPNYSRLYQERGHCHVMRRDAAHAIEAFLGAVNRNPALPGSWRALQSLYRMNGDMTNAQTAASHVAILAGLPVEVVTATSMFHDGELAQAERITRDFLLRNGHHVEAMRLLARIGIEHEIFDDAETLLDGVLALAPDYQAARFDLARTLLARHKHTQALAELEHLLKLEPDNRLYRTTYATTFVGLGDHERALTIYRELLADSPQAAVIQLSIAHCLKTLGRQAEAIDAYRAAVRIRPEYGDAYWSLANLKTFRFTDEEVARMRREEAVSTTPLVDRYHLCFALGKAFEDRAEYAESFHYYERGNELKMSESRYRPEPVEQNAQLQAKVCTREFFEARRGFGHEDPAPIFIVGLPRSGSTLLEQILASHSQVEGTMELADVPRLVNELQGRDHEGVEPRYPGVLAGMTAEDFRRFGERYINDTRIYRGAKPRFIDKMPNNFRHIGLIHLMLPNAKIIDARREPMACCFSNFKQLFASGQEFTYGLQNIARYYRSYIDLMEHWNRVLPGRILTVRHEDVVEDLEGNVRRLLEFCGLDFEPACLEYYKTERSIRTASSEQVRRPIFKEGLDQWRRFEPWLGPLKAALDGRW
ncbi:MAG: tetratricopeptide repeat protein [Steroidobacteraceae bacterium]|nr:tetratricopeptide repeat protein [Steroidobacteraceae bacterium]